jgi:hypothetical protein
MRQVWGNASGRSEVLSRVWATWQTGQRDSGGKRLTTAMSMYREMNLPF